MRRSRQTLRYLPLLFLGYVFFSSLLDSSFRLAELKIEGMAEGEVLQALLPFLGENLPQIDERRIKEALSSNPYIKAVGVKKLYPSSLIIEVEPRKPKALWVSSEGSLALLDEDGRPFGGPRDEKIEDLLLISAPDEDRARRLFEIVTRWVRQGLVRREDLMEVSFRDGEITLFYGEDLAEIVLAERDLDEALKRALCRYRDARRRGSILKRIDGRTGQTEG
jgi:cell division protein FtsQ